jgi:hypothetical protein
MDGVEIRMEWYLIKDRGSFTFLYHILPVFRHREIPRKACRIVPSAAGATSCPLKNMLFSGVMMFVVDTNVAFRSNLLQSSSGYKRRLQVPQNLGILILAREDNRTLNPHHLHGQ